MDQQQAQQQVQQQGKAPLQFRVQLYAVYTAFSLCQRVWMFSLIIILSHLFPESLVLVSLLGICKSILTLAFAPKLGRWIDSRDRLVALKVMLISKLLAMFLVCGVVVWMTGIQLTLDGGLRLAAIISLPVMSAGAELAFRMVSLMLEKDWVVVLCADDTVTLAKINSATTQIDLACATLGPAITGVMFGSLSWFTSTVVFSLFNFVSVILIFIFMRRLYASSQALQAREKASVPAKPDSVKHVYEDDEEKETVVLLTHEADAGIEMTESNAAAKREVEETPAKKRTGLIVCSGEEYRAFARQECFTFMIAFSMLYLTVLSMGPLMISYLVWLRVDLKYVGLCSGMNALLGFLGASVFPGLVSRFGHERIAVSAIAWQLSFVCVAAFSFLCSGSLHVLLMLTAIVLSRPGLWIFDLAARQIAQEEIPEAERGAVNGVWASAVALFELLVYALGILVGRPENFWILATISACMVGTAAGLVATHVLHLLRQTKAPTEVQYEHVPTAGETETGNAS